MGSGRFVRPALHTRWEVSILGSSTVLLLLIVACGLALALVVLSWRRMNKEGFTVASEKREHFVRSVEDVQRQQREEHSLLHAAEDNTEERVSYSRNGFGKQIHQDVNSASEAVKQAMEERGFSLLQAADVGRAVKNKELPASRLCLFYHRDLSGRAVELEPSIGLLHASILIRQDFADIVHLEITDPLHLTAPFRIGELDAIATEIKHKLIEVLHAID